MKKQPTLISAGIAIILIVGIGVFAVFMALGGEDTNPDTMTIDNSSKSAKKSGANTKTDQSENFGLKGKNESVSDEESYEYVAFGEITVDQSEWKEINVENIGISLYLPAELFYLESSDSSANFEAMISNSQATLLFFMRGETYLQLPEEKFYISLKKNDKNFYTETEFREMKEILQEGESFPIESNMHDTLHGSIPHYQEVRKFQYKLSEVDATEYTRVMIDHRFLLDGYEYSLHAQLDARAYEPVVNLINNIAVTLRKRT
jgi:hypothetical protein